MKTTKKKFILIGIITFILGAITTCGIVVALLCGIGNYSLVDSTEYDIKSEFYDEYKDLYIVSKEIDRYYYQDVSDIDKQDVVCKALVKSLGDKYSKYMNKREFENFNATAVGKYSGIGITFSKDIKGNYVILSISPDGPASRSQIKPGDYILKVDGKSYDDQDVLAEKMRGDEGTKVDITYEHKGKEEHVVLTRENIVVHSVDSNVLKDGVGYITINQFVENTSEEFDDAMSKLENKHCDKLILDLRDNGGGLVKEATEIADEFIDSGIITYTMDKAGKRENFNAHKGKSDMELVILVNGNSASASEILVGALQDNGYKVVGERTFGKGIIQYTNELKDGSAIKLTVEQFFTPDGHKVHKKGITPDYVVKNKGSKDDQLEKAKNIVN